MNFSKSIELAFTNIGSFEGRTSRIEALYFLLFYFIYTITLNVISISFVFPASMNFIINLIMMPIGISLYVRRLHDINKSGWYYLLLFTGIGIIPLFYWFFIKKGNNGANSYGENPLR